MSEDYRQYTENADSYAKLINDGRMYVFVPCAIAATTSLLILTASCWSYVFTTTIVSYTHAHAHTQKKVYRYIHLTYVSWQDHTGKMNLLHCM